jgi:N-acetylglucosamine kinase-like BadF-type ATPase
MATWVADIGGSSSRWARIATEGSAEIRGDLPGFNPNSGDPEALLNALSALRESGVNEAHEVFVYGAGCGSAQGKSSMRTAIATAWPASTITVETDLLGAARSMYGEEEGLILILGTGMNCGRYNGKELQTPMPSLGWMLGDEGSGADLGRALLREALLGLLTKAEEALLFPEGIHRDQLMQGVYRSTAQQAFLASFAKKLATPGADDVAERLIEPKFMAMGKVLSHFFPQQEGPWIKAVGSIAWAFEEHLESALGLNGIFLTEVQRDPMEGLVRFHSKPRN